MAKFAPDLLDSIIQLPAQLTDAWGQVSEIELSSLDNDYTDIVIAGMGGSTLGADLLRHAFAKTLEVPMHIVNDYDLPPWINKHTLVILSSYSGTTEETLSCAEQAKESGASIFVMAAGGRLLEGAIELGWPHWKIEADKNPSGQPRMAIGYMVAGLGCLLSRLDLLPLNKKMVDMTAKELKANNAKLSKHENAASELASYSQNRFLLLMSAEHLLGAAHVFNNQINESAKHLCISQPIPELDHHFLEGLGFPHDSKRNTMAVFLQSDLYHKRNRKRIELTSKILDHNGIPSAVIDVFGANRFMQAMNAVQFGSFTSYFLAELHVIDPIPVPNVTALKKMMGK
jgi:glucose/mannose-6-phosphate isomerase